MKALLISEQKELKELLSFQISSLVPIVVQECASTRAGVDALVSGQDSPDLIIAPFTGTETDNVLLKYLRERRDPIPLILFYSPAGPKPVGEVVRDLSLLGTVENTKLVAGIAEILKTFLEKSDEASTPIGAQLDYCPIRTTLLIRATPLKSDIYIRLSAEKFVRLFHAGDDFDKSDLQKYYDTKHIEYMYLKRGATAEFMNQFNRELDSLLARKDLKPADALAAAETSHEAIQELVHRVGFTPEVQELSKKNVALVLKAVGNQPKLSGLLNKVMNSGNYLSQHATLLANVACCVAKEMEWGSDSTFSKLVFASFMHDISLTHPELAKITNLAELEKRKGEFPEDAVKAYHLHPAKSADVVRVFQEIPADVDVIVMQHHERPSGGGFPRGLAHNYIAPLSALFIVAHELTQDILAQKEAFSLPNFVSEKKKFFNQGNFKKIFTALEKVKI